MAGHLNMRVGSRLRDWEFWVGATVTVAALIGLALVPSQVLEPKFGGRSIAFSPKTFPAITLSVMALCGVAMALTPLRAASEPRTTPPGGPLSPRMLAPLAIMLAAVMLMEPVGMPITGALTIAAICYVLGTRNPLTVLLLAVTVPALIWVVFRMMLKVFLPEGWLLRGLL